jgi:signal transduction histidine kinase
VELKQRTAERLSDASVSPGDDGRAAQSIQDETPLTKFQLAALIFVAWTAVGSIENLPELLKGSPWYALLAKMLGAWAWVVIMPVLLFADQRLQSQKRNIGVLIILFLLLSIPVTLVHTYLTALFLYPIPQVTWSPFRDSTYTAYFNLDSWTHYCAIVGILEAIRFYRSQLRLERVERSLSEWRLNALRLHLEPHFLFNALNTISSEVVKRPRLAQDMIADLGTLLRLSLESKHSPEISLAEELTLLDRYLSIQKARFGRRMEVTFGIDPEVLSAKIPSMLLQPLVENAIRHGVEGKRSGGKITISASRVGKLLHLSVADNGNGLPEGWELEGSAGHGLKVTFERLRALYPECGQGCLVVGPRSGGGAQVELRIPFHELD